MSNQYEDAANRVAEFSWATKQRQMDRQSVNLFEAAGAGLVGAIVAKILFGNRGS